jgi:hypothetical protein
MMDIPIYSEDGRVVGAARDGVLYKAVRQSEHLLKMPRGWAWDVVCLEQAEALFIVTTEIYDSEKNITYRAPIKLFYEKGVRLDRKHNRQICLPLMFWRTNHELPPAQLPLL